LVQQARLPWQRSVQRGESQHYAPQAPPAEIREVVYQSWPARSPGAVDRLVTVTSAVLEDWAE
jgi:hypothetical protein